MPKAVLAWDSSLTSLVNFYSVPRKVRVTNVLVSVHIIFKFFNQLPTFFN